MTISQRAIDKRLVLRERMKNFASEKLISALNAELHEARSKYPTTLNLRRRLMLQIAMFQDASNDPHMPDFERWTSGIVLMALLVRWLEEGDGMAFEGLKSSDLETQLDELDKLVRDQL